MRRVSSSYCYPRSDALRWLGTCRGDGGHFGGHWMRRGNLIGRVWTLAMAMGVLVVVSLVNSINRKIL
jgi:hypothetical protein